MAQAIIDLGTNTFHLLIANNARKIVHEEKNPVGLGVGGINAGVITAEAIERAITCLKKFALTCQEYNVTKIQAFGTSALRNASNSYDVIREIKSATGFETQIISGEEEAELIYYGIRKAVQLDQTPALLMDIGGGSVEFIIGNRNEILWKQSIEVGGQRLLEKFHRHDRIHPAELKELNEFLDGSLVPLIGQIKQFNPIDLVGSSGTFETLSDIHCIMVGIPNPQNPESPLSMESVFKIHKQLITRTKDERIAIPGMIAWRAEMIVVTTTLLKYILESHPFKNIKVSRYSLKEGALFR